jgi:hypothetical protein
VSPCVSLNPSCPTLDARKGCPLSMGHPIRPRCRPTRPPARARRCAPPFGHRARAPTTALQRFARGGARRVILDDLRAFPHRTRSDRLERRRRYHTPIQASGCRRLFPCAARSHRAAARDEPPRNRSWATGVVARIKTGLLQDLRSRNRVGNTSAATTRAERRPFAEARRLTRMC